MSRTFTNLFWVVVFGATLPVGVVLSTHLARRSFEKVKLRDQTISVKGYAEKAITSDLAQWSAAFTARHAQMVDAARQLDTARAGVLAFLASRGFPAEQVELSPVSIGLRYVKNDKGNDTNQIETYVLTQRVAIGSTDVRRIADTARAASDLIAQGIEIDADAPTYLFTKLDDLKLEMISQATANAHERGQRLVSHSPNKLGDLRSASQGVFQITPAHSTEVSGSGVNDTQSLDKVIKAVVTVEYAIQ